MKDFRKFISVFILLSLIFSSCSFLGGDNQIEKNIEDNPITFTNSTDEKNTSFFLNPDSDLEIALGGPYYISNEKLDQPFFNEFNKLKQKKVEEAVGITEDIFKDSIKLKKELSEFKKSYIVLFSEILSENINLAKAAKASANILIDYQIKEDVLITNYNKIKLDSKNKAINSYLRYNKTYLAVKLADTVSEDLNIFIGLSVQAITALQDRKAIKKQLEDFDKKMETITNLQDSLANLQKNQILLDTALKQIETANYYMSKGSISFIKQNLPELKQKIESLKQRKDIDKEDIDFLENYTNFYDGLSDSLDKSLENNFDKDRVLEVNVIKEDMSYVEKLLPITYAETEESKGFFSKALKAMKYTAKGAASLTKKTAKFSWKVAKATYKGTKTFVGFTAGSVDATAKSIFDVGFGIYDGRKISEMEDDVFNNFNKFEENVKKGTAGSNLFKNAGEMLDGAEDIVASVPEWGVEKTIGKGRISWGTAGLTKMTVGMFTGLGKGIYKIANAKSTNGEVAEGYLDVGLSFIGGSKVLFKSSKVLNTTSKIKGFKDMIKGGVVFIKKAAVKIDGQAIKGLGKGAIKKLGLFPGKIKDLLAVNPKDKIKELLKDQLSNISKAVKDKIKELSERGLKDIIKSSAGGLDEIKGSYAGFVKDAYERGLKGYLESIVGVVGGSADDYLDNLVGGEIDNLIKAAVKEAIDSGIIPGLEGPFDGKYKTKIDSEDFAETIGSFDIIVVGNILSGNMKFSKSEDGSSILSEFDFKGEIDETGNIESGAMDGGADIMVEGKKFHVSINTSLKGTFTEDKQITLQVVDGKLTDDDGFISYLVETIGEAIAEAFGGKGEDGSTKKFTKGEKVDIPAFNIILTKEIKGEEVKKEANDISTGSISIE